MNLVRYWLPTTRVRVTGTAAAIYAVDWVGRQIFSTPITVAAVSTYVAADASARGRVDLDLANKALADRTYDLRLHPDGRLAGFTFEHVDRLADVLASIGKTVGTVATVVLAVANPAAAVTGAGAEGESPAVSSEDTDTGTSEPEGSTDESTGAEAALYERWAEARPSLAARGESLVRTISEIDSDLEAGLTGLAAAVRELAASGKPDDPPVVKAWTALRDARDELQADLEAIESSAREWIAQKSKPTDSLVATVDFADIPALPELAALLPALSGEESGSAVRREPWLSRLDLRVVREEYTDVDGEAGTDPNASTQDDIKVRLARPARLGVYARRDKCWVLREIVEIAVVDRTSRLAYLPLTGGRGKKSIGLTVGADGMLEAISYSKSSSAKASVEAVQSAVDGVVAGIASGKTALADVVAARESAQKLDDAKAKRLAELTLEKQIIDAETAFASSVAARRLQERKDRVTAHIQKLETQGIPGWEG